MGDPFSVTGTAVGIISLGLQTCQILSKYCSDFKSFPRDVEAVQRQIRGLQGILEGLYEVKERLEIDNNVPSSQLHMALKECEETLLELKNMAEKRNPTSQPKGIQTKVRVVKERAFWSYKKEDLKDVQSSLARFQNNLSLALQCAGLDSAFRRLEELHSELGIQRQQAAKIEQTLNRGIEALEMIRRDASQNPALSALYSEVVSLRTQLFDSSASVRIDSYLSTNRNSCSCESTYIPSGMAITSTHGEDIERSYTLAPQQHAIETRQSNSCRCRPKRKRKSDRKRWCTILTDETYEHSKDCPRSAHGDYTRSFAVQIFMYNSLIRSCVQIGWQYSRRRGWNSPAPVLSYRVVVPNGSPVFKLIFAAEDKICDAYGAEEYDNEVSAILLSTASQLREAFGKGACPTVLDQHGDGILKAVVNLIQGIMYDVGTAGVVESASTELLDACFDGGVPFDDQDFSGNNSVAYWQSWIMYPLSHSLTHKKGCYHVLYQLTQKLENWSVSRSRTFCIRYPGEHLLFDCVSNLLKLESFSNNLDEDDPLLEAILRRSETDFAVHLRARGTNACTPFFDVDYVEPLLSWPPGLHILLSVFGRDASQDLLEILLYHAVTSSSAKSVEILLDHGVSVTWEIWDFATVRFYDKCFYDARFCEANFYDACYDGDGLLWSKSYNIIAHRLYQEQNAGSVCQDTATDLKHITMVEEPLSLYHARCLTPWSAESAWLAGHRGVDSIDLVPINLISYPKDGYGTPLWVQALNFSTFSTFSSGSFELFGWLRRHGANPFWMHPTHLTTPTHVLARTGLARGLWENTYREDISVLLSSEVSDNCQCPCSQHGCRIIECAVVKPHRPLVSARQHRKTLEYLFRIVDNDQKKAWIAIAMIRVLTFEELSLTHTCCYRIWDEVVGSSSRPTPEEAKEIHDLQCDEINLLDSIVAELEGKWNGYNKSFVSFINRVWRPRMRKMRNMRNMRDGQQVDKASHQAKLIQMDIKLKESDQQMDSEAESYGSWPDECEDVDSEGWYTTDEDAELSNGE